MGFNVQLHFHIKMQEKDRFLLEKVKNTLKCGAVYFQKEQRVNHAQCYRYSISSYSDVLKILIPFFKQYPLQSFSKQKNFELFCKVAKLVQSKDHLTKDGLERIRKLKAKMNLLPWRGIMQKECKNFENSLPQGLVIFLHFWTNTTYQCLQWISIPTSSHSPSFGEKSSINVAGWSRTHASDLSRLGGKRVVLLAPQWRDKAAVVKMTGHKQNGNKFSIVIYYWSIAKPRESATESKQPTSEAIRKGNGENASRSL